MGLFQASMLEAMKSLRDEFKTMQKASEVGWIRHPLWTPNLEQANKMTCLLALQKFNNRTPNHPSKRMNL